MLSRRRISSLALAVAVLAGGAACSGDDDGDDAATATTAAETTTTAEASTPDVTGLDGSAARRCGEVFADGADVDQALEEGDAVGCVDDDGELLLVGNASDACTDGRSLFWNDEGWGYGGETWHRHAAGAELVPPADEREACGA